MKNLGLYLLTLIILVFQSQAQEGKIITINIHAISLEKNLVGDSPDRNVSIYLPPSYDEDTNKRYPVLYLLHGFSGEKTGANNWEWAFNATDVDKLITFGIVRPMIIVMPDACNQFGGSMYTNSITTGYWEDFITNDLIDFVDSNYRSIPNRESRGIAGHSMGGYGAIKIAMKHPDIFRSVYGTSSCCMDINP
ncbi:MAG TPA: alpha/beta hydrolase-fold protein, partial [Flavobacteriaceae bacterium]|nr:alpha/beta hydrolase-fold protein [Flavobacteriaceae bacterium]